MGKYADLEVARQQREAGERVARERSLMTGDQRRAAGRAEHAANQAKHVAREQALVAGLAHAATQRQALRSAGLEIVRTGGVLEAKRGGSVLGRWWPDRRPQVGSRSVKAMTFETWLRTVVRAWGGKPSTPTQQRP
jgi:hypothetical protein